MNKELITITVWAGFLGAALVPVAEGFGQGRSSLSIRSPGAMRTIGEGTPTYRFTSYSYGLGALQAPSVGGTSDLLRSSMAGSANFALNRRGAAASSGGLNSLMSVPAAAFSSKGNVYMSLGSLNMNIPKIGSVNPNVVAGIAAAPSGAGMNVDYLKTLLVDAGDEFKSQKAITSLVPSEPGPYHDCIERGENAFKNGDYIRAFTEFRMANTLAGQGDWVSLLSMCHAKFAMSVDVYALSALDLRQAMTYCPELPQLSLQPKEFYSDKNRYVDGIIRLDQHVRDNPGDSEGALLLAYFRWFEQDYPAARSALSIALNAARQAGHSDMTESIQAFWRGMVSTGKVSGDLEPATRPATDSDGPTTTTSVPTTEHPG